MAEILPTRRKTPYNQSINQSYFHEKKKGITKMLLQGIGLFDRVETTRDR